MTIHPTAIPKLYIGMDIQKKSWSVHLRTDISDHKTLTIPSSCDVLFEYVQTHFKGHEVSLTYEAGCCGFSASRYFLNLGWNVLVVNPADVPRKDKQTYQKTDKIDCKNLAKQLHSGQLKGIFIPDEAQDLLKSLLRQRAETAKQLRAIKSNIKALLLYHGMEVPKEFDSPNWSKAFIQWLMNIKWTHQTGKICLDSKLRMFNLIHEEYLQLANELRAYCRKHHKNDYYLLKSIPGIGGYLASAIIAEIGDLRRFSSEAQFASYVGIVPTIRNSGGAEKIQGVTPRCKGLLRSYIIESAWVAFRLDPEMQTYYRKHIGRNPKSIIVKIARKLLNRMLAVIKSGVPYQCSYSLNNGKETKKVLRQKPHKTI
ncbi:MAG: IS110 family transposase [Bacteroidetes bacterium]|nr:IS110 family transposase [Bacteroidota bacterium]